MNVSPNDLAIIVYSSYKENLGAIVTVVRWDRFCDRWLVKSDRPLAVFSGYSLLGHAMDSSLKRICPDPKQALPDPVAAPLQKARNHTYQIAPASNPKVLKELER